VSTIKDVARLAGVGLGTASRVVRGKGSVSQAKLERVKKAIDTLGYRPSHAARSLLYGTSRMIGVYVPLLSGTFYTSLLQVIDTELRGAGLHMMVAFGVSREDARRQAVEGVGFLVERGCDGVIVLTSPLEEEVKDWAPTASTPNPSRSTTASAASWPRARCWIMATARSPSSAVRPGWPTTSTASRAF
jgi:LacI family transcriptional regulator